MPVAGVNLRMHKTCTQKVHLVSTFLQLAFFNEFCSHNSGEQHLTLHDIHVIGSQAKQNRGTFFVAFTNVWMLLNYFRALNTVWSVQLIRDATFNFFD